MGSATPPWVLLHRGRIERPLRPHDAALPRFRDLERQLSCDPGADALARVDVFLAACGHALRCVGAPLAPDEVPHPWRLSVSVDDARALERWLLADLRRAFADLPWFDSMAEAVWLLVGPEIDLSVLPGRVRYTPTLGLMPHADDDEAEVRDVEA